MRRMSVLACPVRCRFHGQLVAALCYFCFSQPLGGLHGFSRFLHGRLAFVEFHGEIACSSQNACLAFAG